MKFFNRSLNVHRSEWPHSSAPAVQNQASNSLRPLLTADGLAARQGCKNIFSDIALHLNSGEVVALLGPNGCGKTTLLRTMLGFHPKSAGRVEINGQDSSQLSAEQIAQWISYVPQYHRTAFGYPVIDMVLMATRGAKTSWIKSSAEQYDTAIEALKWLHIEHLAHRPYTELSGGQRQMVLIARAFAQNTPLIMMDEPTNGLDYGNQIKLLEKITQLKIAGRTVLFTTHHPEHAIGAASRAITMYNGRILKNGPPDEVLQAHDIQRLYQLSSNQLPANVF
ncbi:ABC transporter ATP-binding protein [Thiomicrorhabdus xiamenensis]|uniref:ABC transporter ATP-binding protein n=1 Tax=Thiomicrorhabdus xiamenensis TaxID=2739063 RepID=A0A7D4SNU4_9GAMM|nr:ABC transporter ATP-binding protein [Thiomicrorhabdus xiamenensis]QKI89801.1 ABC transporter ATP-binding protein [Thiomicrorhabdus xiamenensis]